jgi:aryl-alcohol dehydrogenase-like predicted oxidoreductase
MVESSAEFLHRDVPAFGKRTHRLGIAGSYGIDEAGLRQAFDRGITYVYWNAFAGKLTRVLRDLPPSQRQRLTIATGPTLGFTAGALRRRVERVLKLLKVDVLDVFQLMWLGKTSAWTEGTVNELISLKQSGKVRALGVSIHDRPRAAQLALDSPLDLLMLRYNAAHPGAEREIFPHLEKRRPAVVAYTATSWRKLLKRPRGWDGPLYTAGDCYRFCLSSPSVDVVLTGPSSLAQLQENLAAVELGPMTADELETFKRFGKLVHG